MTVTRESVRAIVRHIWRTTLGKSVLLSDASQLPSGSALTASVQISGGWLGELKLACSREMARKAAAAILMTDESAVEDQHMVDSLCEIANIAAGNVMALLPRGAIFSFPVVSQESHAGLAGQTRVAHQVFECDGESLMIELLEEHAPGAPPAP